MFSGAFPSADFNATFGAGPNDGESRNLRIGRGDKTECHAFHISHPGNVFVCINESRPSGHCLRLGNQGQETRGHRLMAELCRRDPLLHCLEMEMEIRESRLSTKGDSRSPQTN